MLGWCQQSQDKPLAWRKTEIDQIEHGAVFLAEDHMDSHLKVPLNFWKKQADGHSTHH